MNANYEEVFPMGLGKGAEHLRRCLERTGDCEQRILGDKTEFVILYSLLSPGTGTDSNSETTEGERAG